MLRPSRVEDAYLQYVAVKKPRTETSVDTKSPVVYDVDSSSQADGGVEARGGSGTAGDAVVRAYDYGLQTLVTSGSTEPYTPANSFVAENMHMQAGGVDQSTYMYSMHAILKRMEELQKTVLDVAYAVHSMRESMTHVENAPTQTLSHVEHTNTSTGVATNVLPRTTGGGEGFGIHYRQRHTGTCITTLSPTTADSRLDTAVWLLWRYGMNVRDGVVLLMTCAREEFTWASVPTVMIPVPTVMNFLRALGYTVNQAELVGMFAPFSIAIIETSAKLYAINRAASAYFGLHPAVVTKATFAVRYITMPLEVLCTLARGAYERGGAVRRLAQSNTRDILKSIKLNNPPFLKPGSPAEASLIREGYTVHFVGQGWLSLTVEYTKLLSLILDESIAHTLYEAEDMDRVKLAKNRLVQGNGVLHYTVGTDGIPVYHTVLAPAITRSARNR